MSDRERVEQERARMQADPWRGEYDEPAHGGFGEVIHSYTRAQAIEDGVLVDVSTVAREAGITFPVALTRGAWEQCVTVPAGVRGQDEAGRLWDVLWMLRCMIVAGRAQGSDCRFRLHVRGDNRERTPPQVELRSVCGPGDLGEPVITVMLPEED